MKLYPLLTPAGSNGQVQYNNGGLFGGDSLFVWDDINKILGIGIATPSTDGVLHVRKDQTGYTRILLENRTAGASGDGTNLRFLGVDGAIVAGNWFDNVDNAYYIASTNASSNLLLTSTGHVRHVAWGAPWTPYTWFDAQNSRVGIGVEGVSQGILTVGKHQNDFSRLVLYNANTGAGAGTNLRFLTAGGATAAGNWYDNVANIYYIQSQYAGSQLKLGNQGSDLIILENLYQVRQRCSQNMITGSSVDVSNYNHIYSYNFDTNGFAVGIAFGVSSNAANVGAAIIHERVGSQSYGRLHFATKASGAGAGADLPIDVTIDSTGELQAKQGAALGDGGTTNYLKVDTDGDTRWVGGGGVPFGDMYTNTTIAVVISDNNPTEIKDATNDGFTAGNTHDITFPTGGDEHYLSVDYAGHYLVNWSISCAQNSPSAAIELEGGVMVGGVAQNPGRAHRTVANSTDKGNMGGSCILDLAASAQVSLYITNETNTTNIDVEHANLTLVHVGGT